MANGRRTYDTSTVRRRNRRTLLDELKLCSSTTRPALAASTGLTVPTVRTLVDDLVRCGLAAEDPAVALGALGRPAASVNYLARDFAIGVLQFGPTYQRVALADGTGLELGFWSDRATKRPKLAVRRATTQLAALAEAAGCRIVTTVAVAPGSVADDHVDSEVLGWRHIDLGALVRSEMSTDAVVVNAAIAGGTAELREGVGASADRFVMVDAGNDVSLVAYVDGRLVTVDPVAIGTLPLGLGSEHTVIDKAGAFPLVQRYREIGGGDASDAGGIFAEAIAGSPPALRAVTGAIRALEYVVRWSAAITQPEVVVIGGALGSLTEQARDLVMTLLEEHSESLPPVRFSEVAAPGWVRGGVLVGVDRVRAIEDQRIRDMLG